MRKYSYELALPVSMIILIIKMNDGNVVPLPKKVKIEDFTAELRPISLTLTLSKVAEHFIVHEHLKPAILKNGI